MARWYVYVARCADATLYCGIARDVAARIAEHDAGTGAKYTRSRGPLAVVLVRRCADQGTALRLEHAFKQLTRARKEALVAAPAAFAALARTVTRRAAARRRAAAAASGARSARAPDRARPRGRAAATAR